MLVEGLQCCMGQEAKQLRVQPEDERRARDAFVITLFGAEQQMWLLLQDESECGNTVDALLPLLILSERVIFEQSF